VRLSELRVIPSTGICLKIPSANEDVVLVLVSCNTNIGHLYKKYTCTCTIEIIVL